jgi:hypothetical protein
MYRRSFLLAVALMVGVLLAGCGALLQEGESGRGGQPESGKGGQSGDVLYRADWSNGHNGWAGDGGWKTFRGQLINDGSNTDANVWTTAPYQLANVAGYAVEADIQVVSIADPQFDSFGIVVRGGEPRSASASASSQLAGYTTSIGSVLGDPSAWALCSTCAPWHAEHWVPTKVINELVAVGIHRNDRAYGAPVYEL